MAEQEERRLPLPDDPQGRLSTDVASELTVDHDGDAEEDEEDEDTLLDDEEAPMLDRATDSEKASFGMSSGSRPSVSAEDAAGSVPKGATSSVETAASFGRSISFTDDVFGLSENDDTIGYSSSARPLIAVAAAVHRHPTPPSEEIVAESVVSGFSAEGCFGGAAGGGGNGGGDAPGQHSFAEPLTARQQVALWLTRTSMADLPSLKSLVMSGQKPEQQQLPRNFSTRSLFNGSRESTSPSPLRKCETVLTLGSGEKERKSSSTMSIFRRLGVVGRGVGGGASVQASKSTGGCHGLSKVPSFSAANEPFGDSVCEFRGMRPVNRHRSTSSIACSRCASVSNSRMTSRATSQMSLMHLRKISATTTTSQQQPDEPLVSCRICLVDTPVREMMRLQVCGCFFCKECMFQYISIEVMEGSYDISCPDAECEKLGTLQAAEMEVIVGKDLIDKHRAFRLNTEVSLDKNRAWCPSTNCNTICHVCDPSDNSSQSAANSAVAVKCPTCAKEFCSFCSANWHPGRTCQQNGRELVSGASDQPINYDKFGGDIKPCPMCRVPIERDAGCAQMMCKRCKHVFCWFCLSSLDDDFLLRHYDSGACKGRLGHSRVSVLWHRAQVIGIFAGFGILFLVASPLILLSIPFLLCCRCKLLDKLDAAESNAKASNPAAAAAESFEVNNSPI